MCKNALMYLFRAARRYLALTGTAALFASSGLAEAAVIDISLVYKASSGNMEFVNTTPPSGFCMEYGGCGSQINSVALPITYDRTVLTGLPPLDQRWSVLVPREETLTLTSAEGNEGVGSFMITHIAQVLDGQDFDKRENPATHTSAGGNCNFVGSYGGGGNAAGFIWRITDPLSNAQTPCFPTTAGTSDQREITASVRSWSIGYQFTPLQPYLFKSGRYHASVTYSVGDVANIALGSGVENLSDGSITFNFTVEVEHELSVTFPAGSDEVELQLPANYGGWEGYLSGLKPPPPHLKSTIPFQLSTTGPFRVTLRCDRAADTNCLIRNTTTLLEGRIEVSINLPPGVIDEQGAPARGIKLSHNQMQEMGVIYPVVNGQGSLEIVTNSLDFEHVMLRYPGKRYRGGFTLVFDAQV